MPLAAIGLLVWGHGRPVVPWLALATVVVSAVPVFSLSATLATYGSAGADLHTFRTLTNGLGTASYGFAGLGVLALCVRLRPVAFIPLGAVLAGLILIGSFYQYIPPSNSGSAVTLLFAGPGFALVIYGLYLWRRNGLSGSLQEWNPGLKLVTVLGIVAGFGVAGLLAYQTEPNRPNWTFQPLDLPRLGATSELVVEGVVVNKEAWSRESHRPSGRRYTIRYTIYRVDVSQVWRGEEAESVSVAVADWSPVSLTQGQSYLLFSSGMANQEDFPGHWRLSEPHRVWTVEDGIFHPHFGLDPSRPLGRERVVELLLENPLSTPTP